MAMETAIDDGDSRDQKITNIDSGQGDGVRQR